MVEGGKEKKVGMCECVCTCVCVYRIRGYQCSYINLRSLGNKILCRHSNGIMFIFFSGNLNLKSCKDLNEWNVIKKGT